MSAAIAHSLTLLDGVSFAELEGLPLPVARYFRRVLIPGQGIVSRARVRQQGEFRLRPGAHGWRHFQASQTFTALPPSFVWDASIRVAPGVHVRVEDSFLGGAGSTRATILRVFPLTSRSGTPEIATAALQRYLAEAVLLPTALLPRCGVSWSPGGRYGARASLVVGTTCATLDFTFDHDGLVAGVHASSRMRDVQGRSVPTPWQGRWSDFKTCDGMLVPRRGEVEWILPSGPELYWRGEMTHVEFDYL